MGVKIYHARWEIGQIEAMLIRITPPASPGDLVALAQRVTKIAMQYQRSLVLLQRVYCPCLLQGFSSHTV